MPLRCIENIVKNTVGEYCFSNNLGLFHFIFLSAFFAFSSPSRFLENKEFLFVVSNIYKVLLKLITVGNYDEHYYC